MRLSTSELLKEYRCNTCCKTLRAECFYKSYLKSNRFRCKSCVSQLKRQSSVTGYQRIIDTLRKSEKELLQKESTWCRKLGLPSAEDDRFTLSIRNIVFIVNIIWQCKPAFKPEPDDKTNLELVRWNMNEPFGLSNNILLTARQARRHYNRQLQCSMAREVLYGPEFCKCTNEKLKRFS